MQQSTWQYQKLAEPITEIFPVPTLDRWVGFDDVPPPPKRVLTTAIQSTMAFQEPLVPPTPPVQQYLQPTVPKRDNRRDGFRYDWFANTTPPPAPPVLSWQPEFPDSAPVRVRAINLNATIEPTWFKAFPDPTTFTYFNLTTDGYEQGVRNKADTQRRTLSLISPLLYGQGPDPVTFTPMPDTELWQPIRRAVSMATYLLYGNEPYQLSFTPLPDVEIWQPDKTARPRQHLAMGTPPEIDVPVFSLVSAVVPLPRFRREYPSGTLVTPTTSLGVIVPPVYPDRVLRVRPTSLFEFSLGRVTSAPTVARLIYVTRSGAGDYIKISGSGDTIQRRGSGDTIRKGGGVA